MASSRKTTRAAPVDCGYSPCQPGFFLRLIAVVTAFAIAMPPLPLVAATWDAPKTINNPFVWPLPSVPLPAQVPGIFPAREAFPSFAIAPPVSPLLPQAPAELPWLPGDLDPIVPPDGMPVQGNPAGLALLENAVGNGIVVGEVSDATSLDPVPGALVEIKGTGRTAEADAQGRFQFAGLPAGTFNIEASQLGYFTDTTVVTVVEGSPTEVRFGLRARPTDDTVNETTLEEESVIGEYQGDSGGDFNLGLALDSPSISANLSKEDFSRAAVSDAGGAVSKISGANIIGGRYAVIRGLGDRYSNTTLNGSLISSADPSRKAVQLDLFPSQLLESIKIDKTFLPNMPAEFAGGLVGIQTLRFPDKPIVDFKTGLDANSNFGYGDEFYVIKGRDLGFWGNSNDGALPKEGLRRLDTAGSATNAERQAIMEEIHSSQGFRPVKAEPDALPLSLEATLGKTFELGSEVRLGVVAAFTHEKGDEATTGIQVGRRFSQISGVNSRSFTEDEYTRFVEWGGLFSAGLQLGKQHEIGYTYFTNNSSSDTVSLSTDVKTQDTSSVTIVNGQPVVSANIQTSQGIYDAAYAIYRGFDQIEPLFRSLDVNQLSGRHSFDKEDRGIKVDWNYAKSDSLENRPHTSTFFNTQLDFTDPRIQNATFLQRLPNPAPPPRFINVVTPEIYDPSRGIQETVGDPLLSNPPDIESFRESLMTTEQATDVNAAVTLPYYFNDASEDRFELRFGGANFEKQREVRGDFIVYRIPQAFNSDVYQNPADDGQFGIDDAANIDSLQLPDGSDRFTGTSNGIQYVDFTGRGFTERNVNASTEVASTFAMGSFYFDKWEISGGFRHESEDRGFELLTEDGLFRSGDNQVNDNNLFGFNLIRTFGDKDNHTIQTAVSRTIARPTFYEFAPVFTSDQATGESTAGNPDLVDSLIDNFDISYSYTPEPGFRYAVNVFQKNVGTPIVKVLDSSGILTWINGQGGSIQGIELEAEKRFGDHFSLTANYTYLNSLLRVTQLSASQELVFQSTFEGQPDQIANIILGYDHAEWGIRTSLVYNYTGQFLVALPADPTQTPSVVQAPAHNLDLVISKEFNAFGYDGLLSFKVTNLLDSDIERLNEGVTGPNGIYDKISPGQGYSISCKVSF